MSPNTEVILDTNVIISAIIFPGSMGREVMELVEAGKFTLVIPDYIRREVLEVINRDFPDFNEVVNKYISKAHETPELPSVKNVKLCMEYLDDLEDSPVLASVLERKPDYFVTADIENFHTKEIKDFLEEVGTTIVTPYGLLKNFGKRK